MCKDTLRKELNELVNTIKVKSVDFVNIHDCEVFLEIINQSNSLITLHDVEFYKPVCLNDAFKTFYGFENNRLKNKDYLYYLNLMHPSTVTTLADSFFFFKVGGHGFLELDYKLRYQKKTWRNVEGVTMTVHRTKKGTPKYAITIANFNNDISKLAIEKTQKITKREKEVIKLLIGGYTQKEIALFLNISYGTVHSHIKNVYKKLEVKKVSELILFIDKHPI
ncbi:helix-turn-helix transcriptional regulator [Wenyingzhuangia aestuarii]|uniref:helix-turn-helix transcriptional regulator n=1 Tax=Wenyingzhuangia aestuarii TaxID=1647582 RepID=UPI00143BCB65|nr:LuxR C-terminal-related transcriptional regulator [Wenyingzhuangia aestuarii]NJB82484.1 DNA-binding CsgD family transcriptional regulator [Wenyingzhuangia aestuarii]